MRYNIYRVYKYRKIAMGIGGQSNHFYSNQISKSYQMELGAIKGSNGGLMSGSDRAAFQALGREASSVFRQARSAENSVENMNTLAQTAAVMGLNVDINQLAAMYDANGDGMLGYSEMQKAQDALNRMSMQQTQMMLAANQNNAYAPQMTGGATGGGGGINVVDTITGIVGGIGELFGGGSSEAGGTSGSSGGGGGWLKKAGEFIGGLFG